MRRLFTVMAAAIGVACTSADRPSSDGAQDTAGVSAEMRPAAPQELTAQKSVTAYAGNAQAGEATAFSDPQTSFTNDPAQQPMIIRNGHAQVEVDSVELAIAQVTQLAKRLGGHVAATSIETGRKDFRTAQMTLRIPAPQFDAAVSGLSPIGKVESQNVTSEDVTEQYVDMTARMTNAKRLEDRLIALLANRTGKLEEVLAVERELARVREEIERYEGRLRYLRTRAAISTLSLHLHEPYPIAGQPGSNVIVEAFKRAWRNFVRVIANGIASLGVIVPFALVFLALAYVLRRLGLWPASRWTRRKAQAGTDKDPPPATPQNPS